MIWLPNYLSTRFGYGLTQSALWTSVTIAGMAQAPVIELRPAAVEQPGGVTGRRGVMANRRGMAETGDDAAGEAVAIGIRADGTAGDPGFRIFRTGNRIACRTDGDLEMRGG